MTAFRSVISQLHCWAGNSFFYHKRATKLAQSRVPLPCSEKAEDVPGEDRAAGGAAARRPGPRPCAGQAAEQQLPSQGAGRGGPASPLGAVTLTLVWWGTRVWFQPCQGAGTGPAQVTLLLASAFLHL